MRSNGERIPFGRTFSLLEDDAALLRGVSRRKAVATQSFDVVVQVVGQIRKIGVVNRRMPVDQELSFGTFCTDRKRDQVLSVRDHNQSEHT